MFKEDIVQKMFILSSWIRPTNNSKVQSVHYHPSMIPKAIDIDTLTYTGW